MSRKRNISRRQFLGEASCAAIGSTTFLSTALNLGLLNTAAARPHIVDDPQDYKAIVCILLAGGADSHNILMPTAADPYADYLATRTSLALTKTDGINLGSNPLYYNYSIPLISPGMIDSGYGIHGGMTRVRDLFSGGNLAFLANIGTLIEPIANKVIYGDGTKQLPLGLYSHSDQIMQWQTSVPQDRSAVGVGGRIADVLNDAQSIPEVSMNISLDGKNRFQSGNQVLEYSISNSATQDNVGFEGLPSWYSNGGFLNQTKEVAVKNMVEQSYSNLFHKTYSGLTKQTVEAIEIFKNALGKAPAINTVFSDTTLSKDLLMMAKVMSVRNELGKNRQIFFTTFGGWDHHDNVIGSQSGMLPVLSNALGEFYESLEELGLQNKVTTFTISDFARTLTSNGNGSDHAWGGNQIIMGGAIDGGKIYGNYPSLALNSDFNLSDRGRMLPTTSVDELYASLALWFGVAKADLSYILPNISNFYTPPVGDITTTDLPINMFSSL